MYTMLSTNLVSPGHKELRPQPTLDNNVHYDYMLSI